MEPNELFEYISRRRQAITAKENSLRSQINVIKTTIESAPMNPKVSEWKSEMANLQLQYVEVPETEAKELCNLIEQELRLPKGEALRRNSKAIDDAALRWAKTMIEG